jgi:hypothetical protein
MYEVGKVSHILPLSLVSRLWLKQVVLRLRAEWVIKQDRPTVRIVMQEGGLSSSGVEMLLR